MSRRGAPRPRLYTPSSRVPKPSSGSSPRADSPDAQAVPSAAGPSAGGGSDESIGGLIDVDLGPSPASPQDRVPSPPQHGPQRGTSALPQPRSNSAIQGDLARAAQTIAPAAAPTPTAVPGPESGSMSLAATAAPLFVAAAPVSISGVAAPPSDVPAARSSAAPLSSSASVSFHGPKARRGEGNDSPPLKDDAESGTGDGVTATGKNPQIRGNWYFWWRILLPVCIFGFIRSFRPASLFLYTYLAQYGVGFSAYSHMQAGQNVAEIIGLFVSGYFVNKWGYRWMIMGEGLFHLSARLLFARGKQQYLFYIGHIVQGFGYSIDQAYYSSPENLVTDTVLPYLYGLSSACATVGAGLGSMYGHYLYSFAMDNDGSAKLDAFSRFLVNSMNLFYDVRSDTNNPFVAVITPLIWFGIYSLCIAVLFGVTFFPDYSNDMTISATPVSRRQSLQQVGKCELLEQTWKQMYNIYWTNPTTSFWLSSWAFSLLLYFAISGFISAYVTEISPNATSFGLFDVWGQVAVLVGTLLPSLMTFLRVDGKTERWDPSNEGLLVNLFALVFLVCLAKAKDEAHVFIYYVISMFFINYALALSYPQGTINLQEADKKDTTGIGNVGTLIATFVLFILNLALPAVKASMRIRYWTFATVAIFPILLAVRSKCHKRLTNGSGKVDPASSIAYSGLKNQD